jgi:spore germination protein (amino acid permease)
MYPTDVISSTDVGHWVPIIIGFIVHFLIITLYMKGLSYFPKKDLISIYLGVGKVVAVVFLLPLTMYLLMINMITIRAYSEIITIVFLSGTPLWAIMALLLIISTYIATKGVVVIFRTGILIACLFIPLILFIFFTSFQNVDWRYVFPIVNENFGFITKPSYYESFFAFAGGFWFLGFVQPYFSYKINKVQIASLALIPFFLFSVYIPILTFGQAAASTFHFPFIVTVDSIHINWLMFERTTMFFLLSLITFIMLFISLVLWSTIRIVSQCIPSINAIYLIISLSVILFIVCLMIPDWNNVKNLFSWNTYLRFYILITIPISTYYFGLRSKRRAPNENI